MDVDMVGRWNEITNLQHYQIWVWFHNCRIGLIIILGSGLLNRMGGGWKQNGAKPHPKQ